MEQKIELERGRHEEDVVESVNVCDAVVPVW